MITIVGVLLAVLILNAICTGGIAFSCNGGFQWSRTYIFEEFIKDSQSTNVVLGDEHPGDPIIYIPLVFYVYGVESPPYTINLEISDETESFEKIFIESVSIEYVDGQKISHNINWEGKFKSGSLFRALDSKDVDVPVKYLSDKLPITVDRRQNCNIRFVGYFVNKEGVKIPFDTTEYFEYENHKWKISSVRGSF